MIDSTLDAILLLKRAGQKLNAPRMVFNDEALLMIRDGDTLFVLNRTTDLYHTVDLTTLKRTN
jgi:hypothetical protein